MTENSSQAIWLLNGKRELLRMREEEWLTPAEMAAVDRGIAALDKLLMVAGSTRPMQFSMLPASL